MKTSCPTHGVHFKDEFEQTLLPDCGYWKNCNGMGLSREAKMKVWDWLFSMPGDEVVGEKYLMQVSMSFQPFIGEVEFKNLIPGYENMTEDERKNMQKEYFKDPGLFMKMLEQAKKSKKSPIIVN